MPSLGRCVLLATATLLVTGATATPAGAIITIGSDLSRAPDMTPVGCAATSCTLVQTRLPGAPFLVSPVGAPPQAGQGVVVRWRIRNATPARTFRLRVVWPSATYSAATGAPYASSGSGAVETIEARLPIAAGQAIGIDAADDAEVLADRGLGSTATVDLLDPALPETIGPGASDRSTVDDAELLLNADVEPDLDRDGYGDETQDGCPTDGRTQGTCLADLSVLLGPDIGLGGRFSVSLAGPPVPLIATVYPSSPSLITGTRLSVAVPAGVEVASTPTLGGADPAIRQSCAIQPGGLTCQWGHYASAASAAPARWTVRFSIRIARPVTGAVVATVTSNLVETNPANNAAHFDIAAPAPRSACWKRSARLGTTGDDTVRGTRVADSIVGLRGNDRLSGLGGADCLDGDYGNDVVDGGPGNDRLYGGIFPGRDTLRGGRGNDRLDGGPSGDVLDGGAGNDTIIDRKGANKAVGGAGDDTIDVRNGKRDVIDCGGGRDRAKVDRIDRPKRCERITRS